MVPVLVLLTIIAFVAADLMLQWLRGRRDGTRRGRREFHTRSEAVTVRILGCILVPERVPEQPGAWRGRPSPRERSERGEGGCA